MARRAPDLATLAATGRPGDWSARGLPARCARLRLDLEALAADAATLAAWWPGGANNPRGAAAWLRCFARYQFLHGQRTAQQTQHGPETDRVLRGAVAAALSDRPEVLELSVGPRAIYPKGMDALDLVAALDTVITASLGLDVQALALGVGDGVDVLLATPALRSLAVRAFLWIVTTEGADVPFGPVDAVEPPAWTGQITPQDYAAVVLAHQRVNRDRNAYLLAAFPRDPAAQPARLGFPGFLAGFAQDQGVDPLDVMRRWALGRVLALALQSATAADEARQRAERERAAGGR